MNSIDLTETRSAMPTSMPTSMPNGLAATPSTATVSVVAPPPLRVRGLSRRINEVRTAIETVNEDILETQRHAANPEVDMTAALNHVHFARALVGRPHSNRYIEDAWRHVHDARRHVVRYSSPSELSAKAIELHQEATSGKLGLWRTATVNELLSKYDAVVAGSSSDPSAHLGSNATAASMIVKACEVRDEAMSNNYRKVTMTNNYTRLLLIALGAVGIPFLAVLTLHTGELRNGGSSCVATSTQTVLPAACSDVLLARPWLLWLAVLGGGMGAIASALQRSSRDRANATIPELVGLGVASLSRVAVGFLAGLTSYLALRSGALAVPGYQISSVMLLAAFTFGFTERIFVLGEKPKPPESSPLKSA
jgi:hypothetical protein